MKNSAARITVLLILVSVLAAPARADDCMLEIAGETHTLEHVYVLRIPEPFDEGVRITRLICTKAPLPKAALTDEGALVTAFHADDQGGVFIDFQDDEAAISVRLSWGEWSTMWSSSPLAEVHFDGDISPERFAGQITTDPPLAVFRKDVTWRVSANVDAEPVVVW